MKFCFAEGFLVAGKYSKINLTYCPIFSGFSKDKDFSLHSLLLNLEFYSLIRTFAIETASK